jgi:flagellar biosynthesis chaperone FliJ
MADYRLQVLLEMRQRAEKEAQDKLTVERKKLAAEKQKLQALKDQKQQMIQARLARRDELTQKMRAGQMSVKKVQEEYRYLDRMAQEITAMDDVIYRQEQAVKAQEVEAQHALEALVEKSKELKAIEKHKEKWAQEVKAERAKVEEDRMEEIGQNIFMFNKNR